MPKTAHGYLRVSTGKQGALGLDAQKEIVQSLWEKHLKDEYPELRFYADEDVSARSIEFKNRPKAKELQLRIQRGDCIIFPKLDRGFRSLRDTLNMFHSWDMIGVRIFCPDFGIGQMFDSASMMGKMLVVMLGLCAEIEGERSKQRMADWAVSQKKMGRASGGFAPYGFKFVRHGAPTGAKRRPPAILQPNDAEREVMMFCHTSHMKGIGFFRIAKHLNAHGYTNRNGKPWEYGMLRVRYKEWVKCLAYEKKFEMARKRRLAPWEFVTPDGVICQRLDVKRPENQGEPDQLLPDHELGEDEQGAVRDG